MIGKIQIQSKILYFYDIEPNGIKSKKNVLSNNMIFNFSKTLNCSK